MMNTLRTFLLIAVMTAIFLFAGFLVAGEIGVIIAFVIALGLNFFSYWNSDKIVLRMYRAREVNRQNAPDFYGIVEQLADNAGLPMPKVYIIENDQPNAFATGRNPQNAAVAATTGLLRRLNHQEIAGVMAHELAHVRNRDTLLMTITATIAGAVSMIANMAMFAGLFGGGNRNPLGIVGILLVAILAPMAAMMVQMAVSRTREYGADKGGAEICGQPLWLASALEKIQTFAQRTENTVAEKNPATAHMFIINPLNGQNFDSLFTTHPKTEERIARLHQLANEWGRVAPRAAARPSPWA